MRFFLLAGVALGATAAPAAPASAAAAPLAAPAAHCPRTTSHHAFDRGKLDRGKSVKPRKLGELPPANQYAAVYRLVRGCEVPLVVRYNIGGGR